MVGVFAMCLAPILGWMALRAALGYSASDWWTAFYLGVVVGVLPCIMWMTVTRLDGSANWRIGALAEEWTTESLGSRRESWHIERSVPFAAHRYFVDVDHVVLGDCGVLVLETKWTSHAIDLAAKRLHPDVQAATKQATENANRVGGLIQRSAPGTDVTPIVVFWGPHVTSPTSPIRMEGSVLLVAGRDADAWLPMLGGIPLEPETVGRIVDRLRSWRVEQEAVITRFAPNLRAPAARRSKAA